MYPHDTVLQRRELRARPVLARPSIGFRRGFQTLWVLAAVVVWLAHRSGAVPVWVAAALFAAWVVKDVLLFPAMRRFYQPQPPSRRIVGEFGTTVTKLSPDGFVRVHGELWQASADEPIAQGTRIRVRDIRGLTLVVDVHERVEDL